MGTSGAYGGSAGWGGVSNDTASWLGDGDSNNNDSADGESNPSAGPTVSPALGAIIGGLAKGIRRSSSGVADGPGGGGGGGSNANGVGSGGRARNTSAAARSGGRAIAGVHGLRSGTSTTLGDLGLSLTDLVDRPKHEQVRILHEAAAGPTGKITESETQLANAELIIWALNEEVEPTPLELANRWVVEYVWQVWVTEAGETVNEHISDSQDRIQREQELRAALEATVSASGLPHDRTLNAGDFEEAIQTAFTRLERIGKVAE